MSLIEPDYLTVNFVIKNRKITKEHIRYYVERYYLSVYVFYSFNVRPQYVKIPYHAALILLSSGSNASIIRELRYSNYVTSNFSAYAELPLMLSTKELSALDHKVMLEENQHNQAVSDEAVSHDGVDTKVRKGKYGEADISAIAWLSGDTKPCVEDMTNPQIHRALLQHSNEVWGRVDFIGWNRDQTVWPKKSSGNKRRK